MISIYEYLEDFDNSELLEDEWQEVMEEQVNNYNEDYGACYAPKATVRNYKSWKREKHAPEQ